MALKHVDTLAAVVNMWTLLLTGKAQEVYATLSPENTLDYEKVQAGILRAYELVTEAYHQKFRRYKKQESQTYCMSNLLVRKRHYMIDGAQHKGLKLWEVLGTCCLYKSFKTVCLRELPLI